MKKHLFLLITVLFAISSYSQEGKKMMKVKDMLKDVDVFYKNLMDIHPYPFVVLSQEEWEQKVDSLKNTITEPMTKQEFFFKMTTFNTYLDLHSSIHASKKTMKKMRKAMLFPKFEEQDNKILFTKDDEKCTLISVGGTKVEEIKNIFFERSSRVEPMYMPTFLNMLRNFCSYKMVEDSIEYKYQNSKGEILTAYFKRNTQKQKTKNNTGTSLEIDTIKSVAVMRVNTFMPSSRLDFQDSIYTYFKRLKEKEITRLYIDITQNSGGLVALTGFLAGFFIDSKEEIYAGTWTSKASDERDMQRFDFLLRKGDKGDYTQRKYTFNPSVSTPKFKGDVYVVQSRNSYSAAAIFASLIQHYYNKCNVIGEEGEIKAFYADPLQVVLPKSKFVVTYSSMFGRFVGKEKNRGVVPDIPYNIYDPTTPFSMEELETITNKE
ncbi:MAG: hypothetical protein II878_04875 [Bacteroidales bacterium]|nr:hypothetical protein [Bacteroidales bacterium]